jgi:hypothetical protein
VEVSTLKDHLVNDAAARLSAKQVEDAAAKVHVHVRQAVDLASLGDYRRAHTEAEQAQGAARVLKELLGTRRGAALPSPRTSVLVHENQAHEHHRVDRFPRLCAEFPTRVP